MSSALFQAVGGSQGCRELAVAFYARVARDSTLRPLFPGKTLRCAIEEFAAFLVQFMDGPPEDASYRWWLSLRESHQRFHIGPVERDAWMRNMHLALDEAPMEESARNALRDLFETSSAYVVNAGQTVVREPEATEASSRFHEEMTRRWDAQRALDEALAMLRKGDPLGALAMAARDPLRTRLEDNRSVHANFLAEFIKSGHGENIHQTLSDDAGLARQRFNGRTLLHAAAAAGDLRSVELLLQLGSDASVKTNGGHTPLYCVANGCLSGGGAVVMALVEAGANVDACDGVKRCTPLHMAARRGNAEVGEVLLQCGADIEARDSLGDTPLRRAVNCGQAEVAALLLSKGADAQSRGSKNLTPLTAARGNAMRDLLQSWLTH